MSSLPPNVDQKDEVSEGKEAPESTPAAEFSCTNVEMVRARFSQPGYVEHNKVGLYVSLEPTCFNGAAFS